MKKKLLLKEVLNTSIYILVVLAISYAIVHFVGQRTVVIGSSMEYTLMDKDNLIVDKLSYRFNEPKRFDIVVFPYRFNRSMLYVKRIIGLPGETVQINEDGEIFINGERLYEGYGREIIENPGIAAEPVYLADDEYFVMGDNRNNSSDSRMPDVGNIKKSELIGKVFIRIWPLREWGKVE
jgi:signal peptidase I